MWQLAQVGLSVDTEDRGDPRAGRHDALVVRSVLVPALAIDLGRWT